MDTENVFGWVGRVRPTQKHLNVFGWVEGVPPTQKHLCVLISPAVLAVVVLASTNSNCLHYQAWTPKMFLGGWDGFDPPKNISEMFLGGWKGFHPPKNISNDGAW